LVIPAEKATPEAINFMARYGRGLICLALDRARVEALGGYSAQEMGRRLRLFAAYGSQVSARKFSSSFPTWRATSMSRSSLPSLTFANR